MRLKKQLNINVGAVGFFFLFSLLFFVLIVRFVSIQVTGQVHGQDLVAYAKELYLEKGTIEAKRGTIYDRNEEVIAEDTASFTLVAVLDEEQTTNNKKPRHVVNKEKTARALAKFIDLKESEILRILNKDYKQVEFGTAGRDISVQTKKEIEDLALPGITFIQSSKRFYPNGVFASHLVGYVDVNDKTNQTFGQLGIEKMLNEELTGTNGKLEFEGDQWDLILPGTEEKITPAENGDNVYLTIDKKIQSLVEDTLNQVVDAYDPAKIVAIVADAKTGEILAMSQRPTFHPKTLEGIEATWHNEAIENSFEPGSTMKIFTLAAAIQEGVYNPNELYQSGSYKVTENSKAIRDHNNGRGWGMISYLEGLQRSSNVAFAKLVKEKIGFDTYRSYLTKFGFDQPSGIDLPNEATGKIVYEYPLDKITTGYGQGSAITPIQQIQAATAIANDGKMLRPHVIDKIVNGDTGEVLVDKQPEVVGTPISSDTAKQVRSMLETVITSPKGTGYNRYNLEGYSVAGKTGTASMTENGVYLSGANDYVFSFLGMAPADDPRLIMYVAVQQPNVEHYSQGSIPVSMIFKPVMQNSLQYLNIKPAEQKEVAPYEIPDLVGEQVEVASEQINANAATTIVVGNGTKVVAQLPSAGEKILNGEKVLILTDGNYTVPDLTGWSLRDVMKLAKLTKLEVSSTGTGYVTKQNISPGSEIVSGDPLVVVLKTPTETIDPPLTDDGSQEDEPTLHEEE